MEKDSAVQELRFFVDKALSSDEVIDFVGKIDVPEGATLFVYSRYGFDSSLGSSYRINTIYLAPNGLLQVAEFVEAQQPGHAGGRHDKVYIQREGAIFDEYIRDNLVERIRATSALGDVSAGPTQLPMSRGQLARGEIPRI